MFCRRHIKIITSPIYYIAGRYTRKINLFKLVMSRVLTFVDDTDNVLISFLRKFFVGYGADLYNDIHPYSNSTFPAK